jgi:DNA-binding GntR family transcriptional regulator
MTEMDPVNTPAVVSGRGRLTERAYNHVRAGILAGRLPVGSVLAENEIAAELGHSRTPVRQALGLLMQDGLVEVGSRRQLVVRGFAGDHRREMLELREALETIALQHACEVMAIEDVDRLRLLLFRQRRAAAEGREDDFIDLDEEFHIGIASAARLPIVSRFLGQLRGFVRLMRLGSVREPDHMTEVIDEHEAILDAIERRDADAAIAALTEHLHTTEYVRHAAPRPGTAR